MRSTHDSRLDETPGVERGYSGRTGWQSPGGIGGSNRLLTVDELAQYLGVPKKTVYGCWQQWGLKAYKIGRHLRFRERHVEDWLRSREA
jgi:excisionase family DNA binding protein